MTPGLLEVRDVTHRFGGLVANSNVSFRMDAGELVGLIGPNGAGKSTLFNLIAGVWRPTRGSIWFDGVDVTGDGAAARCSRGIARTFQVVKSFESMSVLDNVVVGSLMREPRAEIARHRAKEILALTELERRSGSPASALTMAEKRRLEVARALATKPRLLLLDEAMTGLTPSEAQQGSQLVRRIRELGVAILMVEHVMEIVMPLVERVLVLELGRILTEGAPHAVVRDPRVIEAYLGTRAVDAGSA